MAEVASSSKCKQWSMQRQGSNMRHMLPLVRSTSSDGSHFNLKTDNYVGANIFSGSIDLCQYATHR